MDGPTFSMGGQISGGQPDAGLIKDTDTKGFMADVIDASRDRPVIVDFWAPWCGPCKQLGPAIEKAVLDAKGKVALVKVNVDENQALAGQMQIRSIPAVYAFVNGKPVDAFAGALPESEIKAFIDRVAGPSEEDQQAEMLIEAGREALAAQDHAMAAQAFGQALSLDNLNAAALAGLAKAQIGAGELEAAAATLGQVPPDKDSDVEVMSARAALELAETPADDAEISELSAAIEKDASDHRARHDLAIALNAAGRREEAVEHLLHIVRTDRTWEDDGARKQLVKFFEAWGPTDELTVSARRQLSSILFS